MALISNSVLAALSDVSTSCNTNIAVLLSKNLSIPEANLDVIFQRSEPGPLGMDHVNLRFSANKGIPLESLKKVASGGEYSRLMFSLKYIMAGKTSLPTIIFDEIDNGISGEVAMKLGLLMKEMGERHQIIAITHLPQIAARGNTHFFVYKKTSEESTASYIRPLAWTILRVFMELDEHIWTPGCITGSRSESLRFVPWRAASS